MPDALKGVKVNGVEYHFDHEYLDNDPFDANHAQSPAAIGDEVLAYDSVGGIQWKSILPTSGSMGDVLVISGNDSAWVSPDDLLSGYQRVPVAGCDWGAILMSKEEFTDGVGWANIKDALPSFDDSDEGKVLMIQNGELAWGEVS